MLKTALAKLRSLKPTKETLARFGLLVAVAAVFCLPQAAHAFGLSDIGDWLLGELASLVILAVRGVGVIMLMLVQGLIQVLQYTNFTNPGPTAVRFGWVVTRDLSNMFFIVMLMVIALSTAIGWPENYHYSKQLRPLLIVAVMINFSKTITGLIIDLGQVVMMTFVNGILPAAGGNFLNAFQISKLLQLSKTSTGASGGIADSSGLLLGAALALVMVIIATCVVLSLLVMMVWRIVMLWILIIMSPIAFLSKAVPPFAGKYAEWWKELKKYVIAGPVAAFYIWLALLVGQTAGATGNVAQTEGLMSASAPATSSEAASLASSNGYQIPTEASKTDVFLSMIIMTALLLAGLKEAGSEGLDLGVSKYLTGKLKGAGNAARKFAYRQTVGRATTAAKDVGRYVGGQTAHGVSTAGSWTAAKVGGVVGAAGLGVGATLAPRSRAANLRQQALEARKAGDEEKANKLEARARKVDFVAKATAPVRGIVAGVTGVTGIGMAAEAHRSYQDEQRSKAISEAGKKLSLDDALAITKGQLPAKSEAERNAAYKKAVESGKADYDIVAAGRLALQGTADEATIEAYNKTAKEKYAMFFKKDGARDDEKREKAFKDGEVNFNGLAKSALGGVLREIEVKAAEDGKAPAAEIESFMRHNRIPPTNIRLEAMQGSEALTDAVLNMTKTDPNALKQMASRDEYREHLAQRMRTADTVGQASPGADRGLSAWQGVALGALSAADITPDLQINMAQVDQRTVSGAVTSAPLDAPAVQAALGAAVSGYAKYATGQAAQSIMNNPTLNVYVSDAETGQVLNQTRDGNVSHLLSMGNQQIQDNDRLRKLAKESQDQARVDALDAASSALRAEAKEIRDYIRDNIDAHEADIAQLRQQYGAAMQAKDSGAMTRIGQQMTNLTRNVADSRKDLAKKLDQFQQKHHL